MYFRGSLPRQHPRPPCVLATCLLAFLSAGMMFTIMGEGSPISPNTAGTAATSRRRPAPHLRRDEIENNTNFFMYGGGDDGAGGGEGGRRSRHATRHNFRQTQFHLGRAACQNGKLWCFVESSLCVSVRLPPSRTLPRRRRSRGAFCTSPD